MTAPGPRQSNAGDEALREWRRRAADVVLAASVFLHLPILAAFLSGYGPPDASHLRVPVLAAYLAIAAAALLRRLDFRIRIWSLLLALYLIAVLGTVVFPQGPYVRAMPVMAPLLAIGLLGVRSARVALGLSACVLMFAPFLHAVPRIAHALGFASIDGAASVRLTLLQGLGLTADMIVLMILLERFYGFLLRSLAAERLATAERTAAGRKLTTEIKERRRLEHEIARVGDDERRRLGHEIHDGVCQQLTGALLRCQALELRLERGTPPCAADISALSSLLGETIHEARAVAEGLSPLGPTPDALAPALRMLAKRTQQMSGVPCEFVTAGDVLIRNDTTAQHLYRIAQEALSNAVHHARASRITLILRGTDEGLMFRVEDDGAGMPDDVAPGGMGLRTMAFRAQMIEGRFIVGRVPGGGTHVSCRVPRSACLSPEPVPAALQRAIPEGSVV